jgi:hypothetical protein
MIPILKDVKRHFRTNPNISFDEVDLQNIGRFSKDHPDIAKELNASQIYAFPDLRMVVISANNHMKSFTYGGERTAPAISNWITDILKLKRSRKSTRSNKRRTKRRKY